jgi:hypothetical protein
VLRSGLAARLMDQTRPGQEQEQLEQTYDLLFELRQIAATSLAVVQRLERELAQSIEEAKGMVEAGVRTRLCGPPSQGSNGNGLGESRGQTRVHKASLTAGDVISRAEAQQRPLRVILRHALAMRAGVRFVPDCVAKVGGMRRVRNNRIQKTCLLNQSCAAN